MDELICMKMLKININFRIKMKTSFYFIELQLVFSKSLSFALSLIKPRIEFIKKTLIFSKMVE